LSPTTFVLYLRDHQKHGNGNSTVVTLRAQFPDLLCIYMHVISRMLDVLCWNRSHAKRQEVVDLWWSGDHTWVLPVHFCRDFSDTNQTSLWL